MLGRVNLQLSKGIGLGAVLPARTYSGTVSAGDRVGYDPRPPLDVVDAKIEAEVTPVGFSPLHYPPPRASAFTLFAASPVVG